MAKKKNETISRPQFNWVGFNTDTFNSKALALAFLNEFSKVETYLLHLQCSEDENESSYENRIEYLELEINNFIKYFICDYRYAGINYFDDLCNLEIKKLKRNIKKNIETSIPAKQTETTPAKQIEPIWWQRSGRLLGYLMEQLSQAGLIDKQSNFNKLIKEHFIDKDKKQFTDSIAQNRSGAGSNKGTSKNKGSKPKGHNEIDTLIEKLKQHPE